MSFTMGPLGWVRNDAAVDGLCQKLTDLGKPHSFSAARPELKGYWQSLTERGVTGVFLQDAEEALFGKTLPAESQQRGTCVSRGTFRAVNDTYYWGIWRTGVIGAPLRICYEPIYGGSRIQIGRGSLGSGDGSCGAWAAEFIHDYGLLPRGVYGSIDLSKSREDLAVTWGEPEHGVPQTLLSQSASNKVGACFQCNSIQDICDAVSAGYGVAFCSNVIWGDRNEEGISRPASSGGHCEEICGVFLDARGNLCFVRQQSWGDLPNGPSVLKYAGGEKQMRQGSYGAYAGDVEHAMKGGNGDVWAFGQIQPWRPANTAEAMQ